MLKLSAYASLAGILATLATTTAAYATQLQPNDGKTVTPIKHVIVIIGENRTFDHVFGTFKAPAGQTVSNLLSKHIVNADGTPGPNFSKAAQYSASVTTTYQGAPASKTLYQYLPPAMTDGAPQYASDTSGPPFKTLAVAADLDGGIFPSDLHLLLTGATGLPGKSVDTRLPHPTTLPSGPYQLTPHIAYDAYAESPVHRFFQMWQQIDCAVSHITAANPSGCLSDLFPWVETSIGAGSNGSAQPANFTNETTGEGSTSMGFYNVLQGDAPYLTQLAKTYAMSDNYHQAVLGGTGANHIMLGSGDAMYYSDGHGNATTPPANQIENPNPQAGTNNWYTQDGYSGGSYVNCADSSQPGVGSVLSYLSALPRSIAANCAAGHYYIVNNYNPGYFGDGTVDTTDTYTIPPSSVPTIGDSLLAKQVSFRYYGEGYNDYVQDPNDPQGYLYCNICNFLQYTTSIMTNPALRQEHLKDITDFYNDVLDSSLPAVSFIKPSGLNDGHPASSKLDIFEAFVKKIVTEVQANQSVWNSTAIFVTFDEGGGYWDSGYIQPVDFFGDGPRIPLIVVSPYTLGGTINHTYGDHVSLLKFIEKNWKVPPVSNRSRDNMPNPVTAAGNAYVPTNSPALGDLSDIFHF